MARMLRRAVLTAALLCPALGVAEDKDEDCKNHYILISPPPCTVPAEKVAVGNPGAVATDASGNVYFSSPNVVFKLDRRGRLARIAGNGRPGFSGDGGPAAEALLNFPRFHAALDLDPIDFVEMVAPLAVDGAGNVYVGDALNGRIRRIHARGVIETIRGGDGITANGLAVDGVGTLYVSVHNALMKIRPDGSGEQLSENGCGWSGRRGLCMPEGIALDGRGDVYVAEYGYCQVKKIARDSSLATFAGDARPSRGFGWTCGYSGDGGPAARAAINYPFAVAIDSQERLFIADTFNHCIRRVDATGIIATVAGKCTSQGFSGDGGQATEALLKEPHGVAVDGSGNIYIADTGNKRLRKVTPEGVIETVAGNGELLVPPQHELDGERHPYVGLMIAHQDATTVFSDAPRGAERPLWRCSGALISPTLFVTAGHCAASPAYRVDIWFAPDNESGFRWFERDVDGTPEPHPAYTASPDRFDVGVVRLNRPIHLSRYARLPQADMLDRLGTMAKPGVDLDAVGYGLQEVAPIPIGTERVRLLTRPYLREINTPLTGDYSILLSSNRGIRGACFGDSGGPVLLKDTDILAGVASFGRSQVTPVANSGCGQGGGVYRLDRAPALDWLRSLIDAGR